MAGAGGRAAQQTPVTRDTLVYKDGDRVHGRLVEQTGGILVFKSDRFGELRVPAADAVVIMAEKAVAPAAVPVAAIAAAGSAAPKPPAPAPTAAAAKSAAVAAADRADEERMSVWDRFSPSVLTARVRNLFGPWHGRISFATEVVSDVAKRTNNSYEAMVKRKWAADEVQLNGRLDYNKTNDLVTTDLVKVWGQWRREFGKTFFCSTGRPANGTGRACCSACPTITCSCSRNSAQVISCSRNRAARRGSACRTTGSTRGTAR